MTVSPINRYAIDRGTTNMTVFNSVVSTVQEYYREFKRIPDANQCLSRMTVGSTHVSVSKIMASPGFEQSMEMRGIPLTDTRGLSPQQSILLSVLTNPADRRTLSGKLKTAGVSYATYRNWLRNPLFANAVSREAEELLNVHTGDVLVQLTQKATSGDLNAMKFYLEVNGRHDPNGSKGPDATVIVAQVLEIIMRRVKDSAVLDAIAGDLALLGAGRSLTEGAVGRGAVGGGVIPGFLVDPGEAENRARPEPKESELVPRGKSPQPHEAKTPEEWLALNKTSPVGLNFDLPEM